MSTQENEPLPTDEEILLTRILSQAGPLIAPQPDELPEAAEADIEKLMNASRSARGARKPFLRLLYSHKAVLALAASVAILIGAGVGLTLINRGGVSLTVAIALPRELGVGKVFRGEGGIEDAVESGILEALGRHSQADSAVVHLNEPLAETDLGPSLRKQIGLRPSRTILYVTADAESSELLLRLYRRKSGEQIAEERINAGLPFEVFNDVRRVIDAWVAQGVL